MTYKAYKRGILQRLKRMDDGVDTNEETEIAISALHTLYQAALQTQHNGSLSLSASQGEKSVDLGPDPAFKDEGDIDMGALVAEYVDLNDNDFLLHRQAVAEAAQQRKPIRDVG
jgi:hypothetical protein